MGENNLTTAKQAACGLAAEGATLKTIGQRLDISPQTIVRWMISDPQFMESFNQAAESGSLMVLDEIKAIPYREDWSPARARVGIEALKTYLELRHPARYGKHINLNVKTLDMNKALEQARQRAGIGSQVIDSTAEVVESATDGKTFDVDPFS